MVKLDMDGDIVHTAAEGNGPVNALDLALRKALIPKYPALHDIQWTKYKFRTSGAASATDEMTRVFIY